MLSVILGMEALTSLSHSLSYIIFLFSEWRIQFRSSAGVLIVRLLFPAASSLTFIFVSPPLAAFYLNVLYRVGSTQSFYIRESSSTAKG